MNKTVKNILVAVGAITAAVGVVKIIKTIRNEDKYISTHRDADNEFYDEFEEDDFFDDEE